MLPDLTDEQREALKRKYGSLSTILEAEEVVADKAADMLRHYVEDILPNGLKAQVVAISRKAAVRFQASFLTARDALVAEAEALDPSSERSTIRHFRGSRRSCARQYGRGASCNV